MAPTKTISILYSGNLTGKDLQDMLEECDRAAMPLSEVQVSAGPAVAEHPAGGGQLVEGGVYIAVRYTVTE